MSDALMVFWDFDGTLAARDGMWPSVLQEAILAVNPTQAVDLEALDRVLRTGFPRWGPGGMGLHARASDWWAEASPALGSACREAGVDGATTERVMAEVPRVYYRPDAWRILPGAHEALDAVSRAGLPSVILSNHAPELPDLVRALGFAPPVTRTITSASLGMEKPDPRMFEAALRMTGAARDSWMVGDHPVADVAGARAVGMRAMLVHRPSGDDAALTLGDAAARIVDGLPVSR
ncbi:putative hydrolase of the HAD superfamily [Clavibacter michiganensis]|uniref:HAD family hydrolase n=1 Tax=Clavibacter michiganensis TaxID=28447 RepID=UPI001957E866|nr:HAD family hydrolase [Clavibacter michiganensis]MBM7411547.1 putative hydrolase of the HAD superfamily [Clavibacter michiganensis]